MDKYENYKELQHHETEGEDYVILLRKAHSSIAVIAPHGGGIEPGTVDIADAVAGCKHTFYAFKGIKKDGNAALHITSNQFDEPIGLETAENSDLVVAVHGHREKTEVVLIGGRNQDFKKKICHRLIKDGFNAGISTEPGLRGQHVENICNRCRSGQGVQLEISRGLRKKMFDNLDSRSLRKKTILFFKFVDTLKEVL